MSDGSSEWFDVVSVSNDGGASFATGWVRPSGARTGRAGHVRSRWGRDQRVHSGWMREARWVRKARWWVCEAWWARALQGYVHEVPRHRWTG
jgi:hypothetical protein